MRGEAKRHVCLAAAISALAIAGGHAEASTEEVPALEWRQSDEEDLALSETSEVELVSNANTDLLVTFRVEPPTELVRVPDGSVTVPAGQSIDVPVDVGSLEGMTFDGTGRGRIIATAGLDEASFSFQLTAPPSKVLAARVTTWTTTFTRDTWRDTQIRGQVLPLTEPFNGEVDPVLGVLQNGKGDSVTVFGTLTAGGDGIKLRFDRDAAGTGQDDHLNSGDTYTGTIDLRPGDDAGDVELTVTSTETRSWAALVIAVGLLVGLLVKWLVGVMFVVFGLRRRLAAAKTQATQKQAEFEAALPTTGAPLRPNWTITPSATEAHVNGTAGLGWWHHLATLSIDTSAPDIRNADAALASLQAAEDWGRAAADEAAELMTTVEVEGWFDAGDWPALRQAAIAHLDQRAIQLDDIASTRANTVALTKALTGLREVRTQITARLSLLPSVLTDLAIADRRRVHLARGDMAALRYRLWKVASIAELESLKIDERLAAADEVIGSLPDVRIDVTCQAPMMLMGHLGLPSAFDLPSPAAAIAIARDALGKARAAFSRFTGLAIHGFGTVLVISIALLVGVATGLEAEYGDGPWGNTRDYVNAVVWGIGAAAVLQAVESALSAIRGGTTPADATAAQEVPA